jgi:hypothetical protein
MRSVGTNTAASKPRIQAETTGAESDDLEQPTRHGYILEEMEQRVWVREAAVEEDRCRHAVGGNHGRDPTSPITQHERWREDELHHDTNHQAELRERSPAEATYAMVAAGAVTFQIPEMRKMMLIRIRPSRQTADAMPGLSSNATV